MTLVRWNPNNSIFNIFDDVENMVTQAFGKSMVEPNKYVNFYPKMDVNETEKEYLVTLDIPGVDKKDVEINISNGVINISGERNSIISDSNGRQIWAESSFGKFKRSFELGDMVLEDKVNAKFANGVLSISLPKAEELKPVVKNISIK